MCKTITVDVERKGVRGGKCSKLTSNSLSFSITKSVATKHLVNVYRCRSDGWTARYAMSERERGGVCVRGGWMGRRACGWAHLPPVPAHLSPTTPSPPPCVAVTHRACLEPEHGWTGGRPSTRRRSLVTGHSTAHEDDAAAILQLRTVPRCN